MAFLFGPSISLLTSLLFLIFAVVPIAKLDENIKPAFDFALLRKNRPKQFKDLKFQFLVGIDIFANTNAWRMFLPVIIFSLGSNEVYAKTGLVTTLTLVISIMAAKIYGRVIDKKHGQAVIIFTSIVTAVVHFIIPFTRKAGHAIGLKFIGDIMTTGHDISVTRGQFDNSERSNNKLMYFGTGNVV